MSTGDALIDRMSKYMGVVSLVSVVAMAVVLFSDYFH
jgi:hypothetical protein